MNIFSSYRNILCPIHYVFCVFIIYCLSGCYSFTGGSIPDHIKSLYIATVEDNSGYGNPQYRDFFTQDLYEKFRNDNSFSLVESGGDARLYVKISSIQDVGMTISPGELVTENKITISCEAEYYDAVKKKTIWKKNFSNFNVYDISNAQIERNEAIRVALGQTADDILLAVVSVW